MAEIETAENEMNNTKAWAIISTVAVVIGVLIAGTMFLLGMSVGQNSVERCDCQSAKSS